MTSMDCLLETAQRFECVQGKHMTNTEEAGIGENDLRFILRTGYYAAGLFGYLRHGARNSYSS